jgi:flavin-dependent thymidylate synthase
MMEKTVSLANCTTDPTETMMWAFMNMHNKIPPTIEEFIAEQKEKFGDEWEITKKEFITLMASNPHGTVTEYVNFVFFFGGFSRAFQQQLTRTRLASYSIQSLRIVGVSDFADKGEYNIPDRIRESEKALDVYHESMVASQYMYNSLANKEGISLEDARGILPLNITSPITMNINLNSLRNVMRHRMCHLAQGEYRDAAQMMLEEVKRVCGKDYGTFFGPPCADLEYCPMPIHCNKMPYKQKEIYKSLEIEKWLKG